MRLFCLWAVALLPAIAAAGPELKLPAEVRGEAGAFVVIRAETTGRSVRWVPLTPGLSVFPAELLRDGTATVVTAARPGAYRLLAYTAKGDEPSDPQFATVQIEGTAPGPPGPGPGPPTPPPTPPDDPLARKVREALAADPGDPAAKRAHAAAAAGFYFAMSAHVKADGAATVGDLQDDYRAAIPAVLPAGAIPGTRRLVGLEVAALVGDDEGRAIDAALKDKLVDLFDRLARALAIEGAR